MKPSDSIPLLNIATDNSLVRHRFVSLVGRLPEESPKIYGRRWGVTRMPSRVGPKLHFRIQFSGSHVTRTMASACGPTSLPTRMPHLALLSTLWRLIRVEIGVVISILVDLEGKPVESGTPASRIRSIFTSFLCIIQLCSILVMVLVICNLSPRPANEDPACKRDSSHQRDYVSLHSYSPRLLIAKTAKQFEYKMRVNIPFDEFQRLAVTLEFPAAHAKLAKPLTIISCQSHVTYHKTSMATPKRPNWVRVQVMNQRSFQENGSRK